MIVSEVVVLVQSADVVDLARVVEIMLDHHGDDPARLLQLAPVGHARAKQLGIIQGSDTCSESLLPLPQPRSSLLNGREGVAARDLGIVPGELRVAEGMILVHELAAADMLDDVADRALPKRWNPEPVLGRDGVEVAQQRMPIRSLEGLIEQIDKLRDGWCCHALHSTTRLTLLSTANPQSCSQSGQPTRPSVYF
jgi:hypothetical protein